MPRLNASSISCSSSRLTMAFQPTLFASYSQNELLASLRRRLGGAAQATLRAKGLRLRDIGSLVHRTVRASLKQRTTQLNQRQQRLATTWERMPATVVARLQAATPQVNYRCTLDSDDLRLASHWPRDQRKSFEDEGNRLQSARHAEKAAMAYYRNLGHRVEDVSIQELLEGGCRTQLPAWPVRSSAVCLEANLHAESDDPVQSPAPRERNRLSTTEPRNIGGENRQRIAHDPRVLRCLWEMAHFPRRSGRSRLRGARRWRMQELSMRQQAIAMR